MNPNDPNVHLIEALVAHLGELRNQFVFVGGCATGLLVTDAARPPVRATTDVDLVTETATRADYYKLAEQLRGLGFQEDGEVVCRWRVGQLQVDVMPTNEEVLGFSNIWYGAAIETAAECELPNGELINLIRPPLFLATKLEAFHGRGNEDYGVSHDIEDILTVVDGRAEILEEITAADQELRNYLRDEFDALLSEEGFLDSINWHLRGEPTEQARAPLIIERLRIIAGL